MKNIFESTKKDCEIKTYKIKKPKEKKKYKMIINEKEGYFSFIPENKRKDSMKYFIKYKVWNKKTDKIEIIKYDFQTEFKTLLDFFNFIEKYKSVNCIYNDQIIDLGVL